MTGFTRVGWTGSLAGVTVAFAMPALKAADPAKPITFSKDIAPIFQARVRSAISLNSIALMRSSAMATSGRVGSIKTRVATRQMPPWHPTRARRPEVQERLSPPISRSTRS